MNKTLTGSKNILGIDTGSTIIGYGVLAYKSIKQTPQAHAYGYIDLTEHKGHSSRLLQLYDDLIEILKRYKPKCVAIENIYFFKNAKTIIPVVQSKGVILLACAKENIDTYEYTPLQIKQTVSGYGKADKQFIHKMIKSVFNLKSDLKPDDVSDALAVALCHFRHLTVS